MSKFKVGTKAKDIGAKVGDKFRVVEGTNSFVPGDIITLEEDDSSSCPWFTKPNMSRKHDCIEFSHLEPITSKGVKKVTEPKKHLYRLKKDTLEHKAGTVFIEQCTDGTQDFNLFSPTTHVEGTCVASIKRELVVDNPTWFEEVKMEYVPVVKRGRKPGVKKTAKVSTWTPERRAAQSRRMKRIRAARKDTWGK